jgi:hypothetical protein
VGSLADPLSQPLTETERTKAIEIVMRYRDGYRTILETRGRIEEALEQWCSAAGLRAPQNVQDNLRLLTGLAFLTGNLDQDARVAAQWTTQLAPIRQRVDNELLTIKRRVIEDATLNDPKDREFGAKIAFEDVWIKALRGVGSRNILWDTHVSPVVGRREKARARLIADYEALYGGATRTLVINVRQEAPAPKVAGGTLPLPTAKVSLERERKTVSLTREGESDFVARHIKSGTYSLRVAAVGFRSETGAADCRR